MSLRHPLVLAAIPVLLAAAGCRAGHEAAPPPAPEPTPVVEPVPEAPVPADEGKPGVLERLPEIEPPVRDLLVEPPGDGRAPGIVLAHAWWGLDPGTRDLARDLASEGYLVVVPDLFEQVVATSRISATELLAGVDAGRARQLLGAALARLAAHPRFDGRAFLLGVEQGGGFALEFAADHAAAGGAPTLRGLVLDSTNLSPGEELLPRAGCPVLWLVGAGSAAFNAVVERAWQEAARKGGVELDVVLVPGAGVGLLDPRALGFREEAHAKALSKIVGWLRER